MASAAAACTRPSVWYFEAFAVWLLHRYTVVVLLLLIITKAHQEVITHFNCSPILFTTALTFIMFYCSPAILLGSEPRLRMPVDRFIGRTCTANCTACYKTLDFVIATLHALSHSLLRTITHSLPIALHLVRRLLITRLRLLLEAHIYSLLLLIKRYLSLMTAICQACLLLAIDTVT